MQQCLKCQGLVPENLDACPHCRSAPRWWSLPLAIAGGTVAAMTLSACYGPACATATRVTLPDGGATERYGDFQCLPSYDCRADLPDGGDKASDWDWQHFCGGHAAPLTDAGSSGDGGTDGGDP